MDPMKLAIQRRIGIPPQPVAPVYPAESYSQSIDNSISPRLQRLPLLPRPKKVTLADLPMPGM